MDRPPEPMTANEYWEWVLKNPDMIETYELVNGVLVESPPFPDEASTSSLQWKSWIAGEILIQVGSFVRKHDLGRVFGADGGYTLFPNTVRIPDVSFVSKARMPEMEEVKTVLAPDLAVEVISPSESPRQVHEKTTLYLEAGTQLVWNVYPEERVVEVWTQSADGQAQMRSVSANEELDGGSVLPNFRLKVGDIFPS